MSKYIVTQDLEHLMKTWAQSNKYIMPANFFFKQLQDDLNSYLRVMFNDYLFLTISEVSSLLYPKVAALREATTIVSVDRIYNTADYHIESNRIADPETSEVIGEAERPGFPKLDEQISRIPKNKPVTLIDDGMFSGETMLRLCQKFEATGLVVRNIAVGLLCEPGNNVFIKGHPTIKVDSVFTFETVEDWICERDFYIGVPLSGRTAGRRINDGVTPLIPERSLPYCLPFGNPVKCATIPEGNAKDFSKWMIRMSIKLWREVENMSGKKVTCKDVPRLPYVISETDESFADVLEDKYLNNQSLWK